jgi:hypothetical protein
MIRAVRQGWDVMRRKHMKIPYDLKFVVRGFSAKRMAYLLVGISALLIPLHWRSDWQGDTYLSEVAAGATVAALALGFCSPKTDRHRFWPFAVGVAVLVIHSLLQKM